METLGGEMGPGDIRGARDALDGYPLIVSKIFLSFFFLLTVLLTTCTGITRQLHTTPPTPSSAASAPAPAATGSTNTGSTSSNQHQPAAPAPAMAAPPAPAPATVTAAASSFLFFFTR
jgi:predicted lipid-binding transport protein (Tim44 family)